MVMEYLEKCKAMVSELVSLGFKWVNHGKKMYLVDPNADRPIYKWTKIGLRSENKYIPSGLL